MICKVQETIARYGLLDGVKTVCVGVSGGADSVCLLDLLAQLSGQYGLTLRAVHVNHRLRGAEADRDETFVRALCARYGVPCRVQRTDVAALAKQRGESVETCGRAVRYAAFEAEGCDAIAVAHTLSDSVETSLFHLSRGTSVKGAAGIPPKRGNVIRPLIRCTRAEVEAYLHERGLAFVTDSTNLTDDYTRNFLRHQISAPLQARFSGFEKNYARFLDTAALQSDYMEQSAAALLEQAKLPQGYTLSVLREAHPALLQCALALLLREHMEKPPEERHVRLCVTCVRQGSGGVQLSQTTRFLVRSNTVQLIAATPQTAWSTLLLPQQPAVTPVGVFRLMQPQADTPWHEQIDAEKLTGTLSLRSRKAGDRFTSPVRHNSKTLKKLFNELKLPPEERTRRAVLCMGDAVVWVEGVGTDAAFVPSKEASAIVIVEKERNPANDA